ncbi:rhodanese-like domain-containing protein [Novosphingobium piscinae]|uniref:Rhodanese n=1 Tax=Novosphingobium piscinae TaxID=1507448 RepID=A0A7X1KQU7_9SPHN|nr:rhodanese-like domain-containing protein [Novosphingobium piscinae]MBC2670094.1 rhodanese [Novosphingobium piscinae]
MRRRQALTLTLGAPAALLGTLPGAAGAARGQDAAAAAPAALFDADGFRQARYRAPVDRAPDPARRLTLAAALQLRPGHDALFLDVLPAEGARRDPGTGVWRGVPPHQTIPGARWFPEVGRAAPDPVLWRGVLDAVAAARKRHPDWPVVVFCRADCWMGWNAARRLALAGLPNVWWQPEGIDGWHDAGRALAAADPVTVAP